MFTTTATPPAPAPSQPGPATAPAAQPSAPRAHPDDAEFLAVRTDTMGLVDTLSPEDMTPQSMPEASPTKWHLAHTTWFFETFVLAELPGFRPFHPGYAALFNSYYNSVGPQHARPQRGLLTRPSLEDVLRYRQHVDAAVSAALAGGLSPELSARVVLGMHHEQQHQELILTDILHLLAHNPLRPAFRPPPPARRQSGGTWSSGHVPEASWHAHPGGVVEVGHAGAGFCFDNEEPRHRVLLGPFTLAARPVSNGEYLEFIADGGYRRPDLWLSDGWAEVQRSGWAAPLYWSDDRKTRFTLHGERPLDPAAPVCHVSYYEADAYARWAGARLPSEQEWEAVAAGVGAGSGNFVESGRLEPAPQVQPALLGDVWVWTASAYAAYPGYRAAAGALGEYNGKFMCNQFVLRGGSCATPRSHIRASYRNFFPPEARWQFSGIRLAR